MTSDPGIEWVHDERLRVGGTEYVLMNEPPVGDELRIFKPKIMLTEYDPLIEQLQGATIVELGLLDGGSAAYLVQRCEPKRFVGIDVREARCTALDRFVSAGDRGEQVRLHHGVDQADRARLRAIMAAELGDEPIDLVIDDASHRYGPTVASFEELFPLLAPGGWYIIEDWTADDWLELTFAGVVAHREPMPEAIANQWIATILTQPGNVAGECFERWVRHALTDPSSPHHEQVVEWRERVRNPLAGPNAAAIDLRMRQLAEIDPATEDRDEPTLGTLGVQLLLAVKGLCPAIASVSVTPWWIAVRRGGPVPEPFTVASIGRDRLDVLESYRALPAPAPSPAP